MINWLTLFDSHKKNKLKLRFFVITYTTLEYNICLTWDSICANAITLQYTTYKCGLSLISYRGILILFLVIIFLVVEQCIPPDRFEGKLLQHTMS